MIDVKIYFEELGKDVIYADKFGEYKPKNIIEKVYCYLSKKLNLPLRFGPDGFKDFFWLIRYKEWEEYREVDEWGSYEEYLQEKSENSQYGLKNKFGIRDDMTIHFLNFNKFKQKYKNIANDLLVLLNDVISETAKYSTDNGNDLLNITIVIES